MKKILETERTYLREMTQDDYTDLCEILQDAETMYAYEHAFTDTEVQNWLNRQLERYKQFGFSLWAVIDKKIESKFVKHYYNIDMPHYVYSIME